MIKSARFVSTTFFFTILVLGIDASKAAIIYSYVAEPSAVVLDVGSTTHVEIYLQETLTDSSSSLLVATGGLFNAGVSITTATGSSASIASGIGDAAFAGPSLSVVTPSAALFLEGVSITDNTGPEGTAIGNITLVPLASISVQGNSIGQTTFDIGEYNATGRQYAGLCRR